MTRRLPSRVADGERVGPGASSTAEATTAATTATSTEAASSASSTTEAAHLLNLTRNLLLGLTKNANQLTSRLRVLGGEVSVGGTSSTSTTGTADLVDIVLSVGGEVVVDDYIRKW